MSKAHINDQSDQKELIKQALGEKESREKITDMINGDPVTKGLFDSFSQADQDKIIAFLSGEQTLQILCDKFFKKILDPSTTPERVESLVSAIYGEKVKIVDVLPKEGIVITEGGSQIIMDMIIRLSDGSITTVEMQRLGYLFPGERSSCYLADMLMRQYEKVRHEQGKDFSYKDLKKVNLIVIMENSSKEFSAVAPEYIHTREVSFSSGAKVKTLENVKYISLDTYKKREQNEIETELDAWLTFFTAEGPEEVLRLLNSYPEFLPMYKEISEFRKSPEEVIGMFSEALKIMDRNTTKYMIDELHETINSLKQSNDEKDLAIFELQLDSDEKDLTISELQQNSEEKDQTISELDQKIISLEKRIKELEGANDTEKQP